MKFDAYAKLESVLRAKEKLEQQKELEDSKIIEQPSMPTELPKQEVSGIKIYNGDEGTVYLKDDEKKL